MNLSREQVAARILESLVSVARERAIRSADVALAVRVNRIKAFQHGRFAVTYADLLSSDRYGPAARFFLEELYGPRDYSLRDAQFERIVPTLCRLFPPTVLDTVDRLGKLHSLTEALDTEMGGHCKSDVVDATAYVEAWRMTGRRDDRLQQIALTVEVGGSLDHLACVPMLSSMLKMMRAPARAAGLGDLQSFLETGFFTFKALKGAESFLALIESRETFLVDKLFCDRIDLFDPELFVVPDRTED